MNARTALTIKGNDLIGFRTFVEEKAKSMGITGYASNQPDKSVLVVCEGEQTKISELIDSIEKSPFDIEEIQTTHSKTTGEFRTFERLGEDVPKKGATLDDLAIILKSFDNKAEILVKIQRETREEIKGTREEIKGTREEIKKGNKELGDKIDNLGDRLGVKIDDLGDRLGVKIDDLGDKTDSFHKDMSRHFELLDAKYGIIAEMIGKAVEGIEKTNKNMEKNTEKILKETSENTEKILTRMEKQQENHNQLIEKLIKAMVDKPINQDHEPKNKQL